MKLQTDESLLERFPAFVKFRESEEAKQAAEVRQKRKIAAAEVRELMKSRSELNAERIRLIEERKLADEEIIKNRVNHLNKLSEFDGKDSRLSGEIAARESYLMDSAPQELKNKLSSAEESLRKLRQDRRAPDYEGVANREVERLTKEIAEIKKQILAGE